MKEYQCVGFWISPLGEIAAKCFHIPTGIYENQFYLSYTKKEVLQDVRKYASISKEVEKSIYHLCINEFY